MTKKQNIICTSVLFLAIAAVIFWLSNNILWIGDDYAYQFVFENDNYLFTKGFESAERIHSLSDVFRSQSIHYMTVNGRWIVHVIAQIFLGLLEQPVFSVCNAVVYVLLIGLVARLSGSTSFTTTLTVAVMLLLGFNTTFFVTFQTNYVWMAALSCAWLFIYFKEDKTPCKWYSLTALFVFSALAGNGQETYNIGISGALIIRHLMSFKQITAKQWVMFFGFGFGALCLCLSPGMLHRAGQWSIPLAVSISRFITSPRLFYLFLIVLAFCKTKGLNITAFYRENSFWFHTMAIALLFNLYIGVTCARQLFCVELVSIILLIKLLPAKSFNKTILVLSSLFVSGLFVMKICAINKEAKTYKEIETRFVDSDTGMIYYDIPFNAYCRYVSPCLYVHHNNPYNGYNIGSFGSLLQEKYHTDKQLCIYPTAMRDGEVKNQVIDLGDGCYYLLQDKAHPADFYVTREYKLLFFTYPRDEYHVSFDSDNVIENENYRAIVFHNSTPLISNTGVLIKPTE